MRSFFINVLEHYIPASQENFTAHPIADLLRNGFPKSIRDIIVAESDRYIFKGSAGNGRWAACPWGAILDVLVTKSTQDGYYPVYIFREDMSGFYLTLNQGVTSVGQEIKKGYRNVLKKRANSLRMQISYDPRLFSSQHIDLRKAKNTKSHLPGDYEAGNIISKFYSLDNVPKEDELVRDLEIMLSIYSKLVAAKNLTSISQEEKDEVEEINNSNRTQTQKQRLINARLGQGEFRRDVVSIEKNCRITGTSDIAFLIASHIKPWSKSNDTEKLDGNNGLLLSPHVDKLFDKGFISFSDNGEILIKDEAKDVFKSWNLQETNVGSFNKKQQEYLAYHRNQYQF
jgi:5-methylcytosine-specific restriction protein A